MKFYIYESVPQYISYRKMIEAKSLEEAMRIATNEYSDIDAEETKLDDGEVIENLPIKYDAEPKYDAEHPDPDDMIERDGNTAPFALDPPEEAPYYPNEPE